MGTSAPRLDILAPLSGWLVPLDSVPDPVFAGKMVGDGISLDPTSGSLLAPVGGVVSNLHPAHHALTITTAEGVEVMVHVGIDTVMLKGEGFFPLIEQGQQVSAGQPVIDFDLDLVGRKAASLLTQIIITNGETVARMQPATGMVDAGKNVVLSLQLANGKDVLQAVVGEPQLSADITIGNPAGLHARPAAVFASKAKSFGSDIQLLLDGNEANAKSVVAIMGLSTKFGDKVRIRAQGDDAAAAIAELTQLLNDRCGEKADEAPLAPAAAPASAQQQDSDTQLAGVGASPGIAIGRIVHHRLQEFDVPEQGKGANVEQQAFARATEEAAAQLDLVKAQLTDPAKQAILSMHQELLQDPDLLAQTYTGLADGKSAAWSWRAAFSAYSARLEAQDNALLRERANDIRDVGRRVLALLAGVKQASLELPAGSILIAEDLAPSDTASLDPSKVMGFCTRTGGATSHVAILARSLGIPAICGISQSALKLPEGLQVILNGNEGTLAIAPTAEDLAAAEQEIARLAERRASEAKSSMQPAATSDGVRIDVVANIRNAADAREAVAKGAEGVGLLRSEFLFDNRDTAPTEQEQAAEYCAVAEALGKDRPLVVRTLDVGGDKPLSYLPLPKEDNPFLGLRGIRVSLDRPDLLRTQLRAILQAAPLTKLHIMFPMVASLEELRAAKAILAEEQAAAGVTDVKVGIMVEVPSAAVLAARFAPEVDFFSIGTNDLTQYVLAMDRGHPQLAKQADALHPAVLAMIALTCEGARAHGKWVGVCGGLASDERAAPLLVGIGVTELSASTPAVASVKATLSRWSLDECQQLAKDVLALSTATDVRHYLNQHAR
ncbi:phosphoenolpyruvate--protein phosphotransferase [Chromobacterium sinusclupearum]|uniref:phosphoenolpyruvate--protein phosphotransferase n=1 Tax=Chromobacterium sinusclupearum TaxID=2077146 RepID=A0A2K4MRD9_9NEIS|nr:phosphoenolpyruvate--protein phosphotransferase [Chromobacterium sinusclupearum]POA99617.1 phosphoenolpyruvate--protein phosphotransferase [Chromobacterium sinusclupearum]